jgi:N-acetylglucosamine-6-phosphate deacetylase
MQGRAFTILRGSIIDLHTHGIGGLDTRKGDPQTMLKIAEAHGHAFVSAILLSIYPGPIEAMRDQIAAVKEAMDRQGSTPIAANTPAQTGAAAAILGVHLEGPFLNPARSGALDAASFLDAQERTFRRLVDGFDRIVRTITIAPELAGAERLIGTIAKTGIAVNMGHSDATYAEAEAGFRAGARGITHLFNAMRPFHHREAGIVGFGLINRDVYVEMIGDLAHTSAETIEMAFRLKAPERILFVSDSVAETGLSAGPEPRAADGRLLGGAMTLPAAAKTLIANGFDEETVVRAITANPLAYLNA